MTPILTRAAEVRDLQEIRGLLAEVGLPEEGLEGHLHNYFVSFADGKLVGVEGLKILGTSGMVRSVAVHPREQGRGLGRGLLEMIRGRALELGLSDLYLLTLSAESFFRRS